jgi:hypothetical protein
VGDTDIDLARPSIDRGEAGGELSGEEDFQNGVVHLVA